MQRVAREILKELDKNLIETDEEFIILVPKGTKVDLLFSNIKIREIGLFRGHFWEQISLPFVTYRNKLINFCNTAPILKRKQVAYIHDAAVFSKPDGYSKLFVIWYKILFKLIIRYSKAIVTVSEFSKEEIIKYFQIPGHKINVTHIAANNFQEINADTNVLNKFGLMNTDYVLAVSSLHPNKNFNLIIEAIKDMDIPIDIVIAGGANNKIFSGHEIEALSHVKSVGYVSDEELKALYENAEAFVFPSLYEGFGLPPLEAMTVGCPVLASKAASIPEICGEAALYFDPHSKEELLKLISMVYRNKDLVLELKQKGIKQSKRYHWTFTAKQVLEIIKRFNIMKQGCLR